MLRKPTSRSTASVRAVVLAAVAGVCGIAGSASAQQRIDTTAQVQANPMVGSGGENYQTTNFGANYRAAIQNVGTTSVGNGFAFRGTHVNGVNLGTGYVDPFAFRGLLAGQGIDQFIASSTGVPTLANPFASSQQITGGARPVYGGANTLVPPTGFTRSSNSSSYVPARSTAPNLADTRLGVIDYSAETNALSSPGEFATSGQVTSQIDTSPSQIYNTSTLYGVQSWNVTQSQDQGQDQGQNLFGTAQPNPNNSISARKVADLRAQLSAENPNAISPRSGQPVTPGAVLIPPVQIGVTNPGGTSSGGNGYNGLTSGSLSSSSGLGGPAGAQMIANPNLAPAAGDVSTLQSTRQQLPNDLNLPSPGQQSAQYQLLQQRVQEYKKTAPKTDEEANRRFQEILRLKRQLDNSQTLPNSTNFKPGGIGNPGTGMNGTGTTPGMTTPGMIPGTGATPGATPGGAGDKLPEGTGLLPTTPGNVTITIPSPTAPPAAGGGPVQIESYASGIGSKEFAELISSGEAAMKKGQFDKSINIFDQAVAVAPNNSMFAVARANAELGGGYYNRADGELHDAYISDDTMLMSQYDLNKNLGAKRVQTMVDDLKHIAEDSPENETPAFLLAYIMYNTHHPADAAQWLNEADKRSGGNDPVVAKMKRLWVFNAPAPVAAPATQPAPAAPTKK
jgi:tetratricopeptide (TPR) repeat protein